MRSALLLALPLAASACIPDAQGFDEAYLKTWCEAWQDQCTTVLADDPCRGTGAPTISISPPDLDACVYHRAKAALMPLAVLPWVTYLALPVSLHPLVILLPSAAMLGVAMNIAASSFKKYL